MFRRAFCFCVALGYLFALSVPAFATSATSEIDYVLQNSGVITGLFDWTFDKVYTVGANVSNWVQHFYDDDICPQNTETFEGRHEFVPMNTQVDGKRGIFYVCKYCQKAADEIIEPQYDDYVGTLPGKQYNSDGGFLWVPNPSDFLDGVSVTFSYGYYSSTGFPRIGYVTLSLPGADGVVSGQSGCSVAAYAGNYLFCSRGTLNAQGVSADWKRLRMPFTGHYTRKDGVFADGSPGDVIRGYAYVAGDTVSVGGSISFSAPVETVNIPWPAFWVVLYTGGTGGNTYDISTRISGDMGGNLGYVSNGDLVQSQTTTIFNETSNIYANPVTGDTATISEWEYDYSDRSYHLTTNEGDSVSVTYGDEHITINEGGTSYTVYYLVEEPEDVQEDTVTHTHDWVDSVTAAPTCTVSGTRTRTCTICGWVTTEAIPATGHSISAPVVIAQPTCTASGIRAGTCTVCGEEVTSEPVPALGHDYQAVITMEPGCVVTGVRTHTCTRCGDSYTTSVPATGHRWAKVSSVPTQYDEVTGELVQQGYTLYRCQNCNEEYRVTSETGGALLPDAGGGGASSGTGAGNTDLTAMAQEALEASPTVLQLLSGWFTALPASFAGFSGFLKVSFGWMPPEVVTMLSFSVGMICFIGIFRFGFRR